MKGETGTVGIKAIVKAVIIVYYVNSGATILEATSIADQYLEQLKQQILTEAGAIR